MPAQPPTLIDVERERCRRSFPEFVSRAWHIIEPSTSYQHNWHIDLIAEYLSQVPKKFRRLSINIPPRYMKSILVSVMWPVWQWTQDPSLRFLFCSYAANLSVDHSLKRRTILRSDWFRERWPQIKIRDDYDRQNEFQNTASGLMAATSIGGSVTGKGGDIIILDDPIDPSMALSDAERTSANQWLDTTMLTRLNNKQTGAIVLVMHRLHTDDPTAHLTRAGGWTKLSLPSPAIEDTTIEFPSGKTKAVKTGDPLWPERENAEELERQRVAMGSWAFAGQYQQRPAPLGGGIVKRDWFRFYRDLDMSTIPRIIQSWDLTFKKEGTSRVCGTVWGARGADRFLLDRDLRRMGLVETVQAIKQMLDRHPCNHGVLVEDKANGPAVLEVMRSEVAGMIPIEPRGSKEERLQAVSPQIEAGCVYLPEGVPWLEEYLEELCNFPATSDTDQVDSTSQALLYLGDGRMKFDIAATSLQPGTAQGLNW